MKAAHEEQKLNKSEHRFEKCQVSKPAPIHASTGRTGSISLSSSTLHEISQLKMENGKWEIVLKSSLPAQFIYHWKMVLNKPCAKPNTFTPAKTRTCMPFSLIPF